MCDTRTNGFYFGYDWDADPAYQWDIKCKLFSLAEVCARPSAVPVDAWNGLLGKLVVAEMMDSFKLVLDSYLESLGREVHEHWQDWSITEVWMDDCIHVY